MNDAVTGGTLLMFEFCVRCLVLIIAIIFCVIFLKKLFVVVQCY